MKLKTKIVNLAVKSEFVVADCDVFNEFKTASQVGEIQAAENFSDLISLALHHVVAFRLRSNPHLLQKAETNLNNWLSKNSTVGAWLEWKKILETENLENILKIITVETDEGQRLRSSSPFVGLVTKEERRIIIEDCEKARPS